MNKRSKKTATKKTPQLNRKRRANAPLETLKERVKSVEQMQTAQLAAWFRSNAQVLALLRIVGKKGFITEEEWTQSVEVAKMETEKALRFGAQSSERFAPELEKLWEERLQTFTGRQH